MRQTGHCTVHLLNCMDSVICDATPIAPEAEELLCPPGLFPSVLWPWSGQHGPDGGGQVKLSPGTTLVASGSSKSSVEQVLGTRDCVRPGFALRGGPVLLQGTNSDHPAHCPTRELDGGPVCSVGV